MVSLAALASAISRATRPSRGRVFAREMGRPDMRAALDSLDQMVRARPYVEHIVSVAPGTDGQRTIKTVLGDDELSARLPFQGLFGGSRSTFLHNHPLLRDRPGGARAEVPLSLNDHAVAVSYPGSYGTRGFGRMAEVPAAGMQLDRTVGSVALPRKRWSKMNDKRALEIVRAALKAEGEVNRFNMKTTGFDASLRQEAINRALARLGLIDYGSHYGDPTARALHRGRRHLNKTEDAIVQALHPNIFGLPYPIRKSHLIALGAGGVGATGGTALDDYNRRRKRKRSDRH